MGSQGNGGSETFREVQNSTSIQFVYLKRSRKSIDLDVIAVVAAKSGSLRKPLGSPRNVGPFALPFIMYGHTAAQARTCYKLGLQDVG